MNREIKFRAKVNSKYVYSDSYVNLAFYFDATVGYEQEQYTGLKDKNGKEIYEGDILKYITNENTTIKKVVYDAQHGAFIMRCDNYFAELRATYGDDEMYADNYVIIGNIYENPELL